MSKTHKNQDQGAASAEASGGNDPTTTHNEMGADNAEHSTPVSARHQRITTPPNAMHRRRKPFVL